MIKKNTKIVATISDRRCEPEFLKKLIDAGVNVFRLNTAHQEPEDAKKIIDNIRKVSDTTAILIDTKGPEIRTKNIEEPIEIKQGEKIYITERSDLQPRFITNYSGFIEELPENAEVLIDDGHLKLKVLEKHADHILCVAENNGFVKNKKGVNVPNAHFENLASISEKDYRFIDFAIQEEIDFIAHSFVRTKKDVEEIQKILDEKKSKIKIIAKIENEEGVNNANEILDVAYGIMVARGDLGIEVPAAKVPLLQKQLIKTCLRRARPVIVATHMLESMVKNPRPTRAEVSDVANAILDGASAIMLSGETAYGDHPVEAVRVMTEVSLSLSDRNPDFQIRSVRKQLRGFDSLSMLSESAVVSAVELNAKAIIIPTLTGRTARVVASYRSRKMIFALSSDKRVIRQLQLSHGVFATYIEEEFFSTDELIVGVFEKLLTNGSLQMGDFVVVLGGHPGHSTSFMELNTVRDLITTRQKGLEQNNK